MLANVNNFINLKEILGFKIKLYLRGFKNTYQHRINWLKEAIHFWQLLLIISSFSREFESYMSTSFKNWLMKIVAKIYPW